MSCNKPSSSFSPPGTKIPSPLCGPPPWIRSWKSCHAAGKPWRKFSPGPPCHAAERRSTKLSTYFVDTTLAGLRLCSVVFIDSFHISFQHSSLSIDESLRRFRIAIALQLDPRSCLVHLPQVFRRQGYIRRPEILFEPMQLRCPRNRDHPRFLCQHPRQGNLCWGSVLLLRHLGHQVHHRLVRAAILRIEPRHRVAEICFVELRVCIDRAGQEALSQRTERHKSNAKLFQRRQDRLFRLSPEQ